MIFSQESIVRIVLRQPFFWIRSEFIWILTRKTPWFIQRWAGWLAVTWAEDWKNGKVSSEVGIDGEELTTGLVLIIILLTRELDIWEVVDWVEVDEWIDRWKGDVISLVSDSNTDEVIFLRHGGIGKSKGVTPSFPLCSLFDTLVCCNKEVMLSSVNLGLCDF